MSLQPILDTPRLRLRPFTVADGPDVQRVAGDPAVAATTIMVPHPYPDGAAEAWIATHPRAFAEDLEAVFAITLAVDRRLLGAIGLIVARAEGSAELGYWIGRGWWNRGYATEAGRAVLRYAFDDLALERVHARHLTRNPASGRVMEKLGMTHRGRGPGPGRGGAIEDFELYDIRAGAG